MEDEQRHILPKLLTQNPTPKKAVDSIFSEKVFYRKRTKLHCENIVKKAAEREREAIDSHFSVLHNENVEHFVFEAVDDKS